MLISIIVPFYNVEPYFRRCLDSIVNQSYRNIEIILVNDCSPDNSIAIAREYAAKDNRIVIIEHEKNLGLGGARNSGLAAARGEYVWFIDSDDWLASDYAVEHLAAVAKRDGSDIISFEVMMVSEGDQQSYPYLYYKGTKDRVFKEQDHFFRAFSAFAKGDCSALSFRIIACDKLWRKEFLMRYNFRFLIHTLYEDNPTWALIGLASSYTQLANVYYYYYQRSNSIVNSPRPANYPEHIQRLTGQMLSLYDQYWSKTSEHHQLILTHVCRYLLGTLNDEVKKTNSSKQRKALLRSWYQIISQLPILHGLVRTADPNWTAMPGWQALIGSMQEQVTSKAQQQRLLQVLLPKRAKRIKKIIKMLLPYGVIRYIQIQKKKRG